MIDVPARPGSWTHQASPDRAGSPTARSMRWRGLYTLLLLCVAVCLPSPPARAEIYRWRDAEGRLHFSQDLNQVPLEYRAQARSGVVGDGGRSRIQHYEAPPAAVAPRPRSRATAPPSNAHRVHRIRVAATGSTMRVEVRLNDRVTAPFFVDTGASDVVIPQWVAEELGLDLSGARTAFYGTANGTIQQSLVTLESVELGTARATSVPASVSRTMQTGLLGLSFFNHFRYRVDPAAGLIVLEDNGLVEAGRIRGGRSEAQWRGLFAALAARRQWIEREIERTSSNRARRRAELEAMIEEVERQVAVLEDEADSARVPMQWRD